MADHARDERAELVGSLRAAGPGAATLIPDWTTSQLAAHLLLRERSFAELAGRVPIRRFRDFAHRHLDRFVAEQPYERVVDTFAAGPPWWSPLAVPQLFEALNLLEYVVHHEDVRRAGDSWRPRELGESRVRAVWGRLRVGARLTMRSVPIPVRLAWPDHDEVTIGRETPVVTASGDPVELALLAFGRQRVARVEFDGTDGDVATVREATISV
jgi:uncharacterized protein (TIGR03085 family)